jgi:endogenous inhibitor of DNA gyrase (YacG/DUF329 family)
MSRSRWSAAPEAPVAPKVQCPTCRRPIEWSNEFPYRPFCSDRCRLIDLGAWISEKHVIPDDTLAPDAPGEPSES